MVSVHEPEQQGSDARADPAYSRSERTTSLRGLHIQASLFGINLRTRGAERLQIAVEKANSALREAIAGETFGMTLLDSVPKPRMKCGAKRLKRMVGAGRFELPTPCSRSKCATRLRYAPPDLRSVPTCLRPARP